MIQAYPEKKSAVDAEKTAVSPNGYHHSPPSPPRQQDFISILACNEHNQVLVLEKDAQSNGWASWMLVSGALSPKSDPLEAAEQYLWQETGYVSKEWIYLGSYLLQSDHTGPAGHFFCARNAYVPSGTHPANTQSHRWVPRQELGYAILDGRIAEMRYAMTVALSMISVLK